MTPKDGASWRPPSGATAESANEPATWDYCRERPEALRDLGIAASAAAPPERCSLFAEVDEEVLAVS